MAHVEDDLPEVRCPLLLLYSRGDTTVPYGNQAHIAGRVGSDDVNTVTVEDSGHVVTVDREKHRVADETLAFLCRVT